MATVTFKTAATTATLTNAQFIAAIKKTFKMDGKSEAELTAALAAEESRQAIVDKLKQEMPDFGIYLEDIIAGLASDVIIVAKAAAGNTSEFGLFDQFNLFIQAVKDSLDGNPEPVNALPTAGKAGEQVVLEIGRRVIRKKHFTNTAKNAELNAIIVKVVSISTLTGEKFTVRKTIDGKLTGKQQQVSIAVMLPNGTPQSYLVNESLIDNLVERKIISMHKENKDEYNLDSVYMAVNLRGSVAMMTTYSSNEPEVIAAAKKDNELKKFVTRAQGIERVLLFHDSTTATFAGVIAKMDREDFDAEKALETTRKEGVVNSETKALETKLMKEAEQDSKFAFMAKVKEYAKANGDMPLAEAAAELRMFEGLF